MKRLIPIFIVPLFLLFGCGEAKKTEPTQTVEWYSSHDQERKEMLGKCRDNPGELGGTPNCTNAVIAERSSAAKPKKDYKF